MRTGSVSMLVCQEYGLSVTAICMLAGVSLFNGFRPPESNQEY